MRILLDTHVFLWWITDDPRLSVRARELIMNGENELLLSAASGLEIVIKARIGRIMIPGDAASFVSDQLQLNAIGLLSIQMNHALHIYNLPTHHRDPFDRMLIAQSQVEGIPILTPDPDFMRYQVEVIW